MKVKRWLGVVEPGSLCEIPRVSWTQVCEGDHPNKILVQTRLKFSILIHVRRRTRKQRLEIWFNLVSTVTTIMLLILQEVEVVIVFLIKAMFTQDCTLKTLQVGSCQQRYGSFIVQYSPSCSNLASRGQRREWGKQALNVCLLQTTSFFRYNACCSFLHVSSAVWKHCFFQILKLTFTF